MRLLSEFLANKTAGAVAQGENQSSIHQCSNSAVERESGGLRSTADLVHLPTDTGRISNNHGKKFRCRWIDIITCKARTFEMGEKGGKGKQLSAKGRWNDGAT